MPTYRAPANTEVGIPVGGGESVTVKFGTKPVEVLDDRLVPHLDRLADDPANVIRHVSAEKEKT